MAIVKREVIIQAPVKDVYDWVAWAPNFVGVWPNLLRTVNYTRDENDFGLHETVYLMAGIKINVAAQDTVKIPNKKIIAESGGVISSVVTWSFEEIQSGTQLSLSVDYTVQISVLRGFTEAIVVRMNESDVNVLMSNLKQKLETLYKNRL